VHSNILVNSHMEIDDFNEGTEVVCGNGMEFSTEVANRWFVQLLCDGVEATAQRVAAAGTAGAATCLKLTIRRAARQVVGLDRVQFFQPVMWDELYGLTAGHSDDTEAGVPLVMRFSIKSSIDLEVGCTLNNGRATRNWTTNRKIPAGRWNRIAIQIPGDQEASWSAGAGNYGLYFQIGLSCGPDRLSTVDSAWNPGHYLTLANPSAADFLATEGATAWLTACSLSVATGDNAFAHEPIPLARIRTQRYGEKSYDPGTRPGAPQCHEGAYQIRAGGSATEDRIDFKTLKCVPPSGARSVIYSPATGKAGHAYDMTSQTDVPASVMTVSCSNMTMRIHGSVADHVYSYHWTAKI